MTTVEMIENLRQKLDLSDVGIDLMVGSLLLHAKADAARFAELEADLANEIHRGIVLRGMLESPD